jgi:hypothetical protein
MTGTVRTRFDPVRFQITGFTENLRTSPNGKTYQAERKEIIKVKHRTAGLGISESPAKGPAA